MNIIIGTKNQAKVAIVSSVMAEFLPDKSLEIKGVDLSSGVPDSPRGIEIKTGAFNRANAADDDATYSIGIESGLVERFDMWFEEAWACIRFKGAFYYGYSSGLAIPEYVLRKMNEDELEHGPTMRRILKELDWPDIRDTWGTYSAKQISRDISLQEALRNTMIQIAAPKDSLYHL